MRKLYLFLVVASLCVIACNEYSTDILPVEKPTYSNEQSQQLKDELVNPIEELLKGYVASFDGAEIESVLKTVVLNQVCEQIGEDGCHVIFNDPVGDALLIMFNDNGKCQAVSKSQDFDMPKDERGNFIENPNGGYSYSYTDVYYYSRECDWTFDSATNTITTVDEYGETYLAKIVYYDGKQLIYEGMIGDMFADTPSQHKGIRQLILVTLDDNRDLWTEWYEQAISFDIKARMIVDKQDKRLNWMLECVANADGDIDDDLFVETLVSKVFYIGYDAMGTESGCFYGDVSMYYINDGIWYWWPTAGLSPYPSSYLMMNDGVLRHCYEFEGVNDNRYDKYIGDMIYRETKWSYNSESNTLHTTGFGDIFANCTAEVVYFDGNVAILKGIFDEKPLQYNNESIYGLFYVDFTKKDRAELLKNHDLNFNDFYEYNYTHSDQPF